MHSFDPRWFWVAMFGLLLVCAEYDGAARDSQIEAAIAADLKDAQHAALVAMRGE